MRVYNGDNTLLGTATKATVALQATDGWCYIEAHVVIHDTTGSVQVKIDEETVINLTNVDTHNAAAAASV